MVVDGWGKRKPSGVTLGVTLREVFCDRTEWPLSDGFGWILLVRSREAIWRSLYLHLSGQST